MAKILVTGSGGFIGSHLTEYLVEQGHQVKAFVRYNSRNFGDGWENQNILMILKFTQAIFGIMILSTKA